MKDEPFFVEDQFYGDISDFVDMSDDICDENGDLSVPETWQLQVELTTLEPIFEVKPDDIDYMVDCIIDNNEDRIGEEDITKEIKKAILSGIDFEKINAAIPKLYYPNGQKAILTKQDLIDNI